MSEQNLYQVIQEVLDKNIQHYNTLTADYKDCGILREILLTATFTELDSDLEYLIGRFTDVDNPDAAFLQLLFATRKNVNEIEKRMKRVLSAMVTRKEQAND